MLLLVYFDDLIIVSSRKYAITTIRTCLMIHFGVIDVAKLTWFLNVQVSHGFDASICLDQRLYLKKVLERSNICQANLIATEIFFGFKSASDYGDLMIETQKSFTDNPSSSNVPHDNVIV